MRGLADARTGQGPSQGRAARRNRRRDRTASERAVKGGRYGGHRRRRRGAPLTARKWPLRQARAQQGPRGSQRDPWGRSLDRGRAAGPARAPPMRRGRTAATWRPGPVAGAAPSRAGWDGGGPAGPGGGARGPLRRATGGTPHPRAMRGHPLAVPTRNGRRRGGPPLWVPVLLHRGSQSGYPQTAGPQPCWSWSHARLGAEDATGQALGRVVAQRGPHGAGRADAHGAEAWPACKKKLRPRPHRGRNHPISGPDPRTPGLGADHRIMAGATLKLQLYYSTVPAKNPDNLDFWQYMHRLCQYCCILLPNWLLISVTAMAIRVHALGAVCALLCAAPLGVCGVVWHLRGPCRHSGGRWPPAPLLLI